MTTNRCLPRVLAIVCFALSLPAHADEVPEPGRAAVRVDEATLLIDGMFDHGLVHKTTDLEPDIVCHCNLPNVAEPYITFGYQATASFQLFESSTGGPGFRSIDTEALVTKCVGSQCPNGDTGSYGLLVEDPLELLFVNVVLLDFADNLVAPGVTYECDDDGDGVFGSDEVARGDNVDRVIVVDTPNTFDVEGPTGFGW